MTEFLSLACDLIPSHSCNMGVLVGKHESRVRLMYGLGRGSKLTLWDKRGEWEIVHSKACILQVHGIGERGSQEQDT